MHCLASHLIALSTALTFMQQRVVPGHGQLGVGEGELGVVLGRRGSDEIRGQVAGLVIRV